MPQLDLSHDEIQTNIALLDHAVRSGGLQAAAAALPLVAKLHAALQQPQAAPAEAAPPAADAPSSADPGAAAAAPPAAARKPAASAKKGR
jgi:hypothetical protein